MTRIRISKWQNDIWSFNITACSSCTRQHFQFKDSNFMWISVGLRCHIIFENLMLQQTSVFENGKTQMDKVTTFQIVNATRCPPRPKRCLAPRGSEAQGGRRFPQIFTDFSDFVGRLHPRRTRLQKPPNTLGVEESSSPRRVLHF